LRAAGSDLHRAVQQYSMRVNDRYRICFRWTESGVEDVEIVDYH
jgi:plasmid maintenance system killer protein